MLHAWFVLKWYKIALFIYCVLSYTSIHNFWDIYQYICAVTINKELYQKVYYNYLLYTYQTEWPISSRVRLLFDCTFVVLFNNRKTKKRVTNRARIATNRVSRLLLKKRPRFILMANYFFSNLGQFIYFMQCTFNFEESRRLV